MTSETQKSATTSNSGKVPNGVSIPDFLRKYPNILLLWLSCPDNPPYYISPTFLCRWSGDDCVGRVKDRGHQRGIWKTGPDIESILESIDAEMGLEWPQWKYDDAADQRRYSERKDSSTR